MAHHEDREKIISHFGGVQGLIDSGVPSLVFLIAFDITRNLNSSIIYSLIPAILITVFRVIKRDTLQHAFSGLLGVLICALFAHFSHKATGYYLPSVLKAAGFAILYAVSILVGWPLIGVMLGPILGENMEWRKDPQRKKIYSQASWAWFGLFALRFAILYPLYLSKSVNSLGIATLLVGYPPFFLVVWITWVIIRKVPATIPNSDAKVIDPHTTDIEASEEK
jgi:hypothetical protein